MFVDPRVNVLSAAGLTIVYHIISPIAGCWPGGFGCILDGGYSLRCNWEAPLKWPVRIGESSKNSKSMSICDYFDCWSANMFKRYEQTCVFETGYKDETMKHRAALIACFRLNGLAFAAHNAYFMSPDQDTLVDWWFPKKTGNENYILHYFAKCNRY